MAEPSAHRVTPTPRPNGAELHVEGFVSHLLMDLIDLLGRDANLMDRLVAIVDGPAAKPDPFRPETELPTERLVADLSDRLPTSIRQHRPDLTVLVMRLQEIAASQSGVARAALLPTLPMQQDRRAS